LEDVWIGADLAGDVVDVGLLHSHRKWLQDNVANSVDNSSTLNGFVSLVFTTDAYIACFFWLYQSVFRVSLSTHRDH
jgi:hypothetical protein